MIKPKELNLSKYEMLVSENCNMRCKYCFDNFYCDRDTIGANLMSLDMISPIIDFVYETKADNESIDFGFFGGEPMANFEFIQKFVDQLGRDAKFNHSFSMTTNGSLLNSEKIDYLITHGFGIGITLDGTKESHNTNRVFADGSGSWDIITNNVAEYVSKSRMPISLLYVVNDNTINNLVSDWKFLSSLNKFNNVFLSMLFNYDKQYSDEFYSDFEAKLKYLFIDNSYQEPSLFNRFSNEAQCQGYCYNPAKNVTIDTKGNLFFCHRQTPKNGEIVNNDYYGNIKDGYINSEFFYKMLKRTDGCNKDIPECQICEAKNWCSGGCIMASQQFTGDWFKLNPNLCKINKIINKIKNMRG